MIPTLAPRKLFMRRQVTALQYSLVGSGPYSSHTFLRKVYPLPHVFVILRKFLVCALWFVCVLVGL